MGLGTSSSPLSARETHATHGLDDAVIGEEMSVHVANTQKRFMGRQSSSPSVVLGFVIELLDAFDNVFELRLAQSCPARKGEYLFRQSLCRREPLLTAAISLNEKPEEMQRNRVVNEGLYVPSSEELEQTVPIFASYDVAMI